MCLLFLTEALSELSEHYKQTASCLKLSQSHKGTEGWGGGVNPWSELERSSRVCTDFWIQNSRLFPDLFPNNNFFFRTSGSQIGSINRDLKTQEQKLFLWCAANIWARINKIWQKQKKFTYKALVVSLKKNSRLFHSFADVISIFQTFPGLENNWTNFKTFSRIQDSVRTLVIIQH